MDILMLHEGQARRYYKHCAASYRWTVLMIDEAHRIKNEDSNLFKKVLEIPAEFKVLLTATPIIGDIKDMWTLLKFIDYENLDEQINGIEYPSENAEAVAKLQLVSFFCSEIFF